MARPVCSDHARDAGRALLPEKCRESALTPVQAQGSSVLEASANFVNVVVGAGIVGLPWVLLQAGFWTALLELLLCCWLTHKSVCMLIDLGIAHRIQNYEDLAEHALGSAGKLAVSLALLAFDYGAMLSYEIILADAASDVVYELGGYGADRPRSVRSMCLVGCSLVLILPSCLLRDVAHLERLSAVSVLTVVVIIAIVFAKYTASESQYSASRITNLWPAGGGGTDSGADADAHTVQAVGPNVFKSFSIIAFSFVCHDSAFLIFGSLRRPSSARWRAVSKLSLSAALATCLLLAVPGYLTFGFLTEPNLLNNYRTSDGAVIVMRGIYVLTMAFTYPLTFFVARHIVNVWLFRGALYEPVARMPLARHLGLSLGLFFSALAIALVVTNLGDVMSLAGSLGAVVLGFMLPPLCKLRLDRAHSVRFWRDAHPLESARATLPCVGFIAFGTVAIAGSVLQVLYPGEQ